MKRNNLRQKWRKVVLLTSVNMMRTKVTGNGFAVTKAYSRDCWRTSWICKGEDGFDFPRR